MLLLLAAAFLAAVPARAQTGGTDSLSLAIRPGDVVRVTVWQRPEMSGDFEVGQDGHLIHPLFRSIRVQGLSRPELEQQIRTFLTQFQANPQFVVQPLVRVIVEGAVRQPGLHSVPAGITVDRAILEAGGITDEGSRDRVRLLRNDEVHRVDLSSRTTGTRATVQSGDEIVVGRKRAVMRDLIGPVSSVIGATSALMLVVLRWTGRY